jgi:hypothetical protein
VPPVCLSFALCSLKTCGNFEVVAHAEDITGQRVMRASERRVVLRSARGLRFMGLVRPHRAGLDRMDVCHPLRTFSEE